MIVRYSDRCCGRASILKVSNLGTLEYRINGGGGGGLEVV